MMYGALGRVDIRLEVFVTMKNVVCWVIRTQFVLHRKHNTSSLRSSAG
jgi:hypothetical protein